MATYYTHLESNSGGKDSALRAYAESVIREIDKKVDDLYTQRRAYEHILSLTSSVCASCRGRGRVSWYPPGTGPGSGCRRSVRCPSCDPNGYTIDIK